MERSGRPRTFPKRAVLLASTLAVVVPSTGCLPQLAATGIYFWEGGKMEAADCRALEGERVVVVCRPPASNEYRHAGASRGVSRKVSQLLAENVRHIDVVNPREVDNWIDESDWGDFSELAEAVHADLVVHIELDNFELFKGKTLYQGNADVTVSVYNMNDNGQLVWDRELHQILFPVNSGIPAQDKPVQQFQRDFETIVATQIAQHFYRHDPNASFAIDALANH